MNWTFLFTLLASVMYSYFYFELNLTEIRIENQLRLIFSVQGLKLSNLEFKDFFSNIFSVQGPFLQFALLLSYSVLSQIHTTLGLHGNRMDRIENKEFRKYSKNFRNGKVYSNFHQKKFGNV